MDEFEHLKIQLEKITKATSNFSDDVIIGSGGFGRVYVGEVSHSKGRSMVAIKRLDRKHGQGEPEFWKEIMMLSRYTHKNLISLLGFCDEDGEKILLYEHASNGSLDRHLSSISLTWAQRIQICLDVAKGLSYLHDHKGTQQRVLHRDIKSANILLDHNWNAKVSDMGLSKLGPANQVHTLMFTNVVGTLGYCDPQYMMTYSLTKESDVYSFGVVLFEVLSGRLCFKVANDHRLQILVPTWKESYKHKKLDEIIFQDLLPPMDKTSLETFANIAFQCVHESREHRPKLSLIVKELETAHKLQEHYEMKMSKKYDGEVIIKDVEISSKDKDLEDLISKGKRILFNKGKTSIIEEDDKTQRTSVVYGDKSAKTDVACWNVLQFNTGSTSPFIIKCGANSHLELVIKADNRVQEPKGGEIVRVLPRPSILENMSFEEIKEVFSKLPEALSVLALARTVDGTRARYSRLYRTIAMKVPALKDQSIIEEDNKAQATSRFPSYGHISDVTQWNILQFNPGSKTPLIIKCGANSHMELVIKVDDRVQEPKGMEIVRVLPMPAVLETMSLEEIKDVFSKLPEAVSLLALAKTTGGTRARYSRLYKTMAMKVPVLRGPCW